MKLASVRINGLRQAAVLHDANLVLLRDLNKEWNTRLPEDLDALLELGGIDEVRRRLELAPPRRANKIAPDHADWAPLIERARNVWGVGLNFRDHAKDLGADTSRTLPTGFHRPASCLAGHAATLNIPTTWGTITGEAEIGAIVGKPLWRGTREEARDAIVGYTALLDLTAEELLRKDTRYIGRSKAFPQSVVLGPYLVTRDEWEPTPDTLIQTIWNGTTKREGRVRDMTWDPWTLLSDFSHVFPWSPGDVLQTGTPGAVPLSVGGHVAAQVEGLPRLECGIGGADAPRRGFAP